MCKDLLNQLIPQLWDIADLQFAAEDIVCAAKDITSLELYTVFVAVNFWAPHFTDGILLFRATIKLQ